MQKKTEHYFNFSYIIPLFLVILIWIIYNLNFKATISGDVYGAAVIPLSLIQHHSIYLDSYYHVLYQANPAAIYGIKKIGEHYYSFYPVVLPIIVTPLYALFYQILALLHAPLNPSDNQFFFIIYLLQKITASGLTSISVVFLYYGLKHRFSNPTAILASFIYGFCTLTWAISSQSLWQQCLIEFLLSIAIYIIIKNNYNLSFFCFFTIGILSGLLCLGRPSDSVLLLPIIALLYKSTKQKFGIFIFGALISSIPFIIYNMIIFHSIFGGYSAFLDLFSINSYTIQHIIALLISPSRGLFVFSPILILIFPGIFYAYKTTTNRERNFNKLIFITILVSFIMYGSFECWYGGWGYGPRFLVSMTPYCILIVAYALEQFFSINFSQKKHLLLWIFLFLLIFFSFFIQVIGSYHIDRGFWDTKFNLSDEKVVWNWKDNQISYTFLSGPNLWFLEQKINPLPFFLDKPINMSLMKIPG